MEIELYVRTIKNGYIVWNNGNFDSVFCRDYDEVIEAIKEALKKYIK